MGNIFGTSMLSLKISLFSLTILSAAMILKLSYPLIYELPLLWVSIRSWLTPPFLYLLINFIIITIAASSRFQNKLDQPTPTPTPDPLKIQPQDFVIPPDYPHVVKSPVELRPVVALEVVTNNPAAQQEVSRNSRENPMTLEEDISNLDVVSPARTESMELPFSMEKPPVSARFGHRKVTKGSSEGKTLKVSKPKRQDTLESTWKMITEGRSMPLTRHLKKSDTWEVNQSHSHSGPPEQVKKSETFNDRSNVSSSTSSLPRSQGSGRLRKEGSGKLRKEPSLSQDDLNRRVEAFINKFNEEMRLQRMESLNRYKEMMSNGAQY